MSSILDYSDCQLFRGGFIWINPYCSIPYAFMGLWLCGIEAVKLRNTGNWCFTLELDFNILSVSNHFLKRDYNFVLCVFKIRLNWFQLLLTFFYKWSVFSLICYYYEYFDEIKVWISSYSSHIQKKRLANLKKLI